MPLRKKNIKNREKVRDSQNMEFVKTENEEGEFFTFLRGKKEGVEEDLCSNDVKQGIQTRSNGVQDCSEGVQDCSNGVQDDAWERSIVLNEHSWNIKSAKNAEYERHSWGKRVIFIFLFTGCICLTMHEEPIKYQLYAYMGTLAAFIFLDPFEALDRFLAPQTRCIIAMLVLMIIVNIAKPSRSMIIVTLVCALLGGFVSRCLNKKWLAAHNWLMSAEAQKALRIDPEHTASGAWRAHGRRETRTILYSLGFDVYDDILDAMHKPVYCCGYLHGLKKETELNRQIDRLTIENEKSRAEQNRLQERVRMVNEESRLLKMDKERAKEDAAKWKLLYEEKDKLAKLLEQANKELCIDLQEEIEKDKEECIEPSGKITKLTRAERDAKIRECLDLNMSNSQIRKVTGASAGTVSAITKIWKAEKQEAS